MDRRIFILKKQILIDLTKKQSVKKMAVSVKLSVPHLRQLFKSELGMTIFQYIREQRLKKACELLEEGILQVKQIGIEIGLRDSSRFTKDFKARYGLTPTLYRQQYWEKVETEKPNHQ